MHLRSIAATVTLFLSGAACAGGTANAGVTSEYLFRGIEQSGGAAVQGGIDFSFDTGLYLGSWASNTGGPAASGASEVDLYAGWTGKAGPISLDFGAIYYLYNEDKEDTGQAFDYPEVYAKLAVSNFGLQVHYSNSYLGDANESVADALGKDTAFLYVNLVGTFPLSGTLTLGVQVGNSSGEGAEVAWDASAQEGYTDYSVTLSNALESGFSVSLGLFGTTLDAGDGFGTVPYRDDDIKPIVAFKKTFELCEAGCFRRRSSDLRQRPGNDRH